MVRLPGILKVAAVLSIDFFAVYALFHNATAASATAGAIALYVWLGGYLALFKEGAVRAEKLPRYERSRFEAAKCQLAQDVEHASAADISGLKLYLIVEDRDMQATAYGANCISVSGGAFDHMDPVTLNAVLAHEISHILNFDAEFNRAVFATILLICGAISVVSFTFMAVIFLIFLVCDCFRSWLGVMAFKGTTRAVGGIFSLLQKGIVVLYRCVASCLSRAAEFRSDRYSAQLGYGVQLAHFLSCAAPESNRQLTLTEALYRTHPPAPKRVARLESIVSDEAHRITR